jgi:TonB family protein
MSAELLAANLAAHWIQAGVLSIVALGAVRALRVKDPRLTLSGFHVVLLLIVVLPWMQHWRTTEPSAPVIATASATVAVDVSAPLAAAAPPLHVQRPIDPAMTALSVIAAGIALRLAWLLLGFVRLRHFVRQTQSVAPTELAEEIQARVGAVARYLEHPTAGSPSTFGIFRPRVVLPARFASLSAAHQEGALCHELIHVRRHDVAAALAEEALIAMLWFHPWVWVIRRRIRVAREQVVDLRVLTLTGNREEYVRCLIEMSGHDLVPHLSQAGAAMVRSNELRARVDAIFQEVRMSRLRLTAVSAILAAVVGMAGWAAVGQVPLYAMASRAAANPEASMPAPVEHPVDPVSSAQATITVRPRPTETRGRVEFAAQAQQAMQPPATVRAEFRRLIKVAYSEYPPEALDKQISGTVKAAIVVNSAGEVTMADVTSGPQELRAAAFKSLMGLKYAPGADTVRINVAMEYRLDPQGWGVRVIQESGIVGTSFTIAAPNRIRAELPANLGVPVRVGGDVPPPKKIKDAPPIYPPVAQEARVQGVVILEATIDDAGNVVNTKILRSIPLLDQAASDAVLQWKYTPALLNGVPVPVIMTVTVNFTLRGDPNVSLTVILPAGNTVAVEVMDQAGVGIVDVPNVGKFGFTPIRGASPTGRMIAIYQVGDPGSPLRPFGNVQVELNGGVVQSSTTPSFGIELVRLP